MFTVFMVCLLRHLRWSRKRQEDIVRLRTTWNICHRHDMMPLKWVC